MKNHLFAFIGILGFLTSCSPRFSYFTEDLYEKQKWSENDVMRIQFFVSKDITLTRSLRAEQSSIQEGKIRIKNGQRIEQVVIKAGTPGILVIMPKEDRFAISFEEGDNEAYLMFGPNPKYYDRFALLARDWDREQGKVSYRGQEYQVDASSAYAALMVDLRREGQTQYQSRKVGGRVIKG
jgi:hypothetical protein